METRVGEDGLFWQDIGVIGSPASDFNGLICLPQFDGRAIPAFAKTLLARNWTGLRLSCWRGSRKRTRLLMSAFSTRDFIIEDYESLNVDGINNWICPYIDLPDNWDAYLEKISANTRQKVRRFLRKVEGSDEFRITVATPETAERDIAVMTELWGKKWVEERGLAESAVQEDLKDIIMRVNEGGDLFMPMLWQGDKPLGGLAIIADRKSNAMLFFAAGRDITYKGPPVGLVLHAFSIRHAIAEGYKVYDFLRGDETYKFSFATDKRVLRTIVVRTKDGKNWGGKIDPLAVPVAFYAVAQAAKAGRLEPAERGCRQILEVAPSFTEARNLCARLTQTRVQGNRPAPRRAVPSVMAARPRVK
jgi:CelD/BcsL family acetyltransferase involved in cellulose biosynthesis